MSNQIYAEVMGEKAIILAENMPLLSVSIHEGEWKVQKVKVYQEEAIHE